MRIVLAGMAVLFLVVATFSGCSTESSPANISDMIKSTHKQSNRH